MGFEQTPLPLIALAWNVTGLGVWFGRPSWHLMGQVGPARGLQLPLQPPRRNNGALPGTSSSQPR